MTPPYPEGEGISAEEGGVGDEGGGLRAGAKEL